MDPEGNLLPKGFDIRIAIVEKLELLVWTADRSTGWEERRR